MTLEIIKLLKFDWLGSSDVVIPRLSSMALRLENYASNCLEFKNENNR